MPDDLPPHDPARIVEDVFGSPHLSLLAKIFEERLRKLHAEGLELCPAERVESVAWFLAEAVLEHFSVEERGWTTG